MGRQKLQRAEETSDFQSDASDVPAKRKKYPYVTSLPANINIDTFYCNRGFTFISTEANVACL